MRSRYTIREPGGLYFITFTVVEWIPLFTRKPYFDILLDSLLFCRQHKGLKLYAYVILDNHLHLVVAGDRLTDIIRDFAQARRLCHQVGWSYPAKRLSARSVGWALPTNIPSALRKWWAVPTLHLKHYKQRTKARSDFQVWQEGFHPQQIVSQEMLHQKIDCLHHNPVRASLVARPEDWVYSSARDYAGGKGVIELDALE